MKNEDKIYQSLKNIEEWAFSGISEKEIAALLGMAYSTFREQKKKIPALSALLKKSADFKKQEAKKQVDEVQISLYNRCLGYNAKVQKVQKVKRPLMGKDGSVILAAGKPVYEEVLEAATEETHIPADVQAIKFFLLNKARKDWQNDPERVAIEKKRLANDTKRTRLAEQAAMPSAGEKSIEEILQEAEAAQQEEAEEESENEI